MYEDNDSQHQQKLPSDLQFPWSSALQCQGESLGELPLLYYGTRELYCPSYPPRNNTQSGQDYNYRVEEGIELYFGHLTS